MGRYIDGGVGILKREYDPLLLRRERGEKLTEDEQLEAGKKLGRLFGFLMDLADANENKEA